MSRGKPKSIVCIGGGGHARVVMDAIRSSPEEWSLVGFTDPDAERGRLLEEDGAPYLGDDQALGSDGLADVCWAVLGVGSIGDWRKRQAVVEALSDRALEWGVIRHSSTHCSDTSTAGPGTVVLPGAVVNAGARLGRHCIVNTGAVVEHDCRLDDWVHVAPGACVGGDVRVGEGAHLGLGCRIREGLTVGRDALVAMGAVVTEDIPAGVVVMGCPATVRRERTRSHESEAT